MAVSFVAAAAASGTTGTTGFTITIPTVATGDLLVLSMTSRDHTAGTAQPTVTDNDGGTWNQWWNSSDRKAHLWYRFATAATTGKTITATGCVGSATGVMKAFRGAHTGTPLYAYTLESNASGDESTVGFTPDFADMMLCAAVMNYANDNSISAMSYATAGALTLTERVSTGGSDCAVIFGHVLQAGGPTATGTLNWTQATDGASYSFTFAVRPAPDPAASQVGFRGRNDDDNEVLATWKAAQNTNWSQPTEAQFRVRFEIEETASAAYALNAWLEYRRNSGTWLSVDASSSVVRMTPSIVITDGDPTTNLLTASAKSFIAGFLNDSDGSAPGVSINNQQTEVEFCCYIREADVADGDTIELRVTDAGAPLDVYTVTPSLTVQKIADGTDQPSASVTGGNATGTNTNFTFASYNVGTARNRVLAIGISTRNGPVTAVDFGGVALTKIVDSASGTINASWWYLINPSGTADIHITITSTGVVKVAVITLSGANQVAPVRRSLVNRPGFTTAITKTIERWSADDIILDMIAGPDNGSGATPDAGAAQIEWFISNVFQDCRGACSSDADVVNPATMAWTVRGEEWVQALVAFRSAAGPKLVNPLVVNRAALLRRGRW